MRAQAFEKMNEKLVEELEGLLHDHQCLQDEDFFIEFDVKSNYIKNLIAKSKILSDRDDDRAASVIRELNNEH